MEICLNTEERKRNTLHQSDLYGANMHQTAAESERLDLQRSDSDADEHQTGGEVLRSTY